MKILYVANIRLPTEKAHGVQIMKMCEAFAQLGHTVELIVTDRNTHITEDPFVYYGVKNTFSITRLHVPDTVRFGRLGFFFESVLFARRVRRHLRTPSYDIVYGRDELVLSRLPGSYVWETHTGAWNRAARTVAQRAKKIVAISQGLKDFYVGKEISADKIIVAHDGIDLEQFANPESIDSARVRLGLPQDKKIAMYVGRLDGWKGTDTLLEASKLLPEDTLVAIIGGEPQQVANLSVHYPHVRFLGFRPYKELADNQAAADVLVLPNTGKDEISARFTSPLKLFSYMASGKPIVASDLSSIREVVDEKGSFFSIPDDSFSLAETVQVALNNSANAQIRAAEALKIVRQYEWKSRAAAIVGSIVG